MSTATEEYTTDRLSRRGTLTGILAAAVGGGLFAFAAWFILRMTSWPAFNTSNMTYALSTAATLLLLAVVGTLVVLWALDEQRAARRREADLESHEPEPGPDGNIGPAVPDLVLHRPRWRVWLTYLVSYLSPAALVVSTTGIPLSATRLYLEGIHIDQGFRTQFLTRMATTWGNQDMNYIDLPTYYPLGWFWLGGRMANLLDMPGWEVYQPWALVSLGLAASMLVPVWQRITGSLPVAVAIALVSTAVMLVMAAEEPYGAVVALGAPAATVLAGRALRGAWFPLLGTALFLGVSASFYTLYTAVVALSVVALGAVLVVLLHRSWAPLLRLVVLGSISLGIASVAWGPYLWHTFTGHPTDGSTAPHYLPVEGAQIPVPFLSLSLVGLLCLIGLVWLVIRFATDDARSMAIGLIGFYLWAVASMAATLAGTTLLGFRVDALIVLQLATAGVLGLAELRLVGLDRLYPDRLTARGRRYVTIIMIVILTAAGLHYAQQIPVENQRAIDRAYSDTDGYGERADRYAADSGRYYGQIDEEIRSHGHDPLDTVVFTDEINFLAYHPYFGFQAFTSHYANPLGEFRPRNDTLLQWAESSWTDSPREFTAALDDTPWRGPDVFVLRGTLTPLSDDATNPGWKSHIAEDIYPNNPNVRYRGVYFNPEAFTGDAWETTQIGPFVVATRVKDAS